MGAGPDPSPFPITDEPTMTNEMPGLSGRDVIDVRQLMDMLAASARVRPTARGNLLWLSARAASGIITA
jgi:hypothetical protein